jgi:hypothetical protein
MRLAIPLRRRSSTSTRADLGWGEAGNHNRMAGESKTESRLEGHNFTIIDNNVMPVTGPSAYRADNISPPTGDEIYDFDFRPKSQINSQSFGHDPQLAANEGGRDYDPQADPIVKCFESLGQPFSPLMMM